MKLISLRINEPHAGWRLEKTSFFSDVTLLVGLSGVGKTRILESIRKLAAISKGKSAPQYFGIDWMFEFEHDEQSFVWKGQFEQTDEDSPANISNLERFIFDDDENVPKPNFASESLIKDGKVIATRDNDVIMLNGEKTPKLSTKESLIHILQNEEGIGKAYAGMDSILMVDQTEYRQKFYGGFNFEALKKKFSDIDKIRSADIPTHQKLALAHENCRDTFADISAQFREAFPHVEEIGVKLIDFGPVGKMPRLFMREEGVENIIQEESISSGMHRTLMHLSRMSLWPDGTVVLVDEFENSFGINCIDYVTNDLKVHSQRMQFVLTSHHPYIINNIDKKHWMIVSRGGSTVKVQNSDILSNSASHHEAFLQLLNLPMYHDGIKV